VDGEQPPKRSGGQYKRRREYAAGESAVADLPPRETDPAEGDKLKQKGDSKHDRRLARRNCFTLACWWSHGGIGAFACHQSS
jgi:hypothetical protein